MSYIAPVNGAAFDLGGHVGYVPPTDAAQIRFDLADQSGEPGIVYPIPPMFMVSAGQAVTRASGRLQNSRNQRYDTAARRELVIALRTAGAGQQYRKPGAHAWDATQKHNQIGAPSHWNESMAQWPTVATQGFDQVPPKDIARAQPWDRSIQGRDDTRAQGFNVPPARDVAASAPHRDSNRYWERPSLQSTLYKPGVSTFDFNGTAYAGPGGAVVDFNFKQAWRSDEIPTRPLASYHDVQDWRSHNPRGLNIRHPWDRKGRLNTEVDFDYEIQPNPPTDHEPPEQPDIKESYEIMNSSSLVTLPERTPLAFQDLEIALDIDSFSWSCSATLLNSESVNLVKPTAAGPVEIEASVNGHTWVFVVERYSVDQRFARERYRIQGVSRTQLLAEPYAPKRTRRIAAPTNAQQIMHEELEFTGFTVSWQTGLPDYVVPADAWGYQDKTAIEVIDELAKAVGAVIIPARNSDTLNIRHRYRIAPWSLDNVIEDELDAIIPDTLTLGYSSQWSPKPLYDAVFVSGISAGVSVEVIRTGLPGAAPAPDLYDDLNVDPAQCAARGRAILGESGNQEVVSVDVPLPTSGAPGLVMPGALIEWRDTRDGTGSWRGLVLENKVSVSQPGAARVIQSLQIERHHY